MNSLQTQPDTLIAMLWVQRMSRDFTRWPANPNWSSLEFLEKAFFNNYPGMKGFYFEFKADEGKKWGVNFSDSFQKHSLYVFLAEHIKRSDMTRF